jgi:hypothetical protein
VSMVDSRTGGDIKVTVTSAFVPRISVT